MRLMFILGTLIIAGTNLSSYALSPITSKTNTWKTEIKQSRADYNDRKIKGLAKSLSEKCARDLPDCHFETIHSLGEMGPKAKSAIPELRGILYDYVHGMYAAAALSRIAPELKIEYLEILIRALNNDVYLEEESNGKKIKKWVNTSNSIQYSEILDALGDLGPLAKQAVPNIQKFLAERISFNEWDKVSGERALKRITGEVPERDKGH